MLNLSREVTEPFLLGPKALSTEGIDNIGSDEHVPKRTGVESKMLQEASEVSESACSTSEKSHKKTRNSRTLERVT